MSNNEAVHELLGHTNLSAQMTLVESFLNIKKFKSASIERQVAVYPFVGNIYKGSLICKIMKELWPYDDGEKLFQVFNEFENFLTAIGKRGHFIHQFEVFLLGTSLMVPMFKKNRKAFKVSSINKLVEVWLLASMTHDFGYPIQFSEKILTTVSGLYRRFELDYVSEKFNSVKIGDILDREENLKTFLFESKHDSRIKFTYSIETLIERLYEKYFNNIKDETVLKVLKDKKDHGYVSSSILFRSVMNNHKQINGLADIEKMVFFKNLEMSMAAVLGHNFYSYKDDYIEAISFDKNPYAFILFLIDNIQDWNRNVIYDENHPEYHLTDVKLSNENFKMTYNVIRDDWNSTKKTSFEKAIKEKNRKINLAQKPKDKIEFFVCVDFFANDSSVFNNRIEVSF